MTESSSKPALLNLPDATLAYHRLAGKGPGVMFCGGFMSDMTGTKATVLEDWCRRQGRAFVRFDYQGHGASSGRFEDGTIGQWHADALAVFDKLTVGPQVLVGSSMGGWIALLLALARPARVAGLVTVACAADFIEALWQRLDAATRETIQRDGVIHLPSDFEDGRLYPIRLRLIEEARQHQLLTKPTLPIACPARLLHGMQDQDAPWQTSLLVAERLTGTNARMILVKDGGHRMSRVSDLVLLTDVLAEVCVLAEGGLVSTPD